MCKTPFCASLFCFGGQNPNLVFNQRQLVAAIFAGICVCTSVWEAAASLHRDSPLESAQFFGKNGNEFLAQSRAAFFSLSITCQSLRKPVSCLLGFHTLVLSLFDVCLPLNYLSLIYFNGTDVSKIFNATTKKAWLIGEDVPICKISEALLLFRSDKRFSKSWQLKTCCHEARAVFSHKLWFETISRNWFNWQQRVSHRDKTKIWLHSFLRGFNLDTSFKNVT